jgi:glycosyltransferase involved in cell wall biosynthesis
LVVACPNAPTGPRRASDSAHGTSVKGECTERIAASNVTARFQVYVATFDGVSSPPRPTPNPLTGTRKRISTPVLAGIGPERLRIALVCDWFLPRMGGLELHLRDLAQHLNAAGHTAEVITSVPGDPVVEGVRVHRIEARRIRGVRVIWTRDGMRKVRQAVEQGRYDVVHSHVSILSPVAYAGARAGQRLNLPTVLTFHSLPRGPRFLRRLLGRALGVRRWQAIMSAVSTTVADAVAPLVAQHSVLRLPNGIDPAFWRVAHGPKDPSEMHLITVMRLDPKKRPHALLAAFAQLRIRVPDRTFWLRIVGDGPQRPKLERLVRKLGLQDHVYFLGYRTREQIRDLFADADVFVLPSKLESFGLAALEARTAGLPVVAMAQSGVADFIHDGREGLLATSDDHLVEQLARLARETELREQIAEHNQDRLPPLGWQGVIARHLRLYREAIAMRLPR